jgi:DHA1 family multidrug resistance protein-like MFS transporter
MTGTRSMTPDRRSVYILSLIGFFAIFSTTLSKNPVLPLFSQALGAGDVVIGLIAAVSPLAGILFSFPVGVLSDHLGRRRLLVASGVVFLTAPLLYLLVFDPLWLIPVRFFHGMATAILGRSSRP